MPTGSKLIYRTRCEACPLKDRPVVFGHGCKDHPDVAFVGEAPGETEVEQGQPFVGKSGQFLRKMLHDLGFDEQKAYFTNICMCNPTKNATPTPAMAKACRSRLIAELVDVKPKLIVTLGAVASKFLAMHKASISRSHGIYRELTLKSKHFGQHTVGIVPLFHPSYVLRSGGGDKKAEPFRDFLEEMQYVQAILAGHPAVIEPPYENYVHITTQAAFEKFCAELSTKKLASCDLETDTMDFFTARILCIGFSWKRGTARVVDWALLEQNIDNLHLLNNALANVQLAFQNGLYDIPFMYHNGLTNAKYYVDTMQMHYLLDERQGTHGLERLAIKYYRAPAYKTDFREELGIRGFVSDTSFGKAVLKVPQKILFDYNGADVDYTYRLAIDLVQAVKEDGQLPVLKDIEMPSCRTFTEFYMKGLLVDHDYLEKLGKTWTDEENSLHAQMSEMVMNFAQGKLPKTYKEKFGPKFTQINKWMKDGFNAGSTTQLAHFMYDCLSLLPFGGKSSEGLSRISADVISEFIKTVDDPEARDYWTSKRTAMSESAEGTLKGISARTTQAYMLYWLRQQHDFPGMLLKWRHVRKRRSMYYTALKDHLYVDGRVRPQYNMTATRTGRKSTAKPAIHNLPRGDEIYNIFIPEPGWCLIHADYAQAEMRMMAHYSGDRALMHVLDTEDIHTIMVMEMYKLTPADIEKMPKHELMDRRIAAKMITFGLPYGRSAAGLAPQIGVTTQEAQGYIDAYFKKFPVLKQWIDRQRARGVAEQEIVSVFGRRRRFPLIVDRFHKKEVERQAGNMAIQSAINDLTLLAYVNSIRDVRAAGIPILPGAHIHDSVNFTVPIPLWKPAVDIILKSMAYVPFPTEVQFPCELEVGMRWGSMITVHKKGKWSTLDPEDPEIPVWLHRTIPHLEA